MDQKTFTPLYPQGPSATQVTQTVQNFPEQMNKRVPFWLRIVGTFGSLLPGCLHYLLQPIRFSNAYGETPTLLSRMTIVVGYSLAVLLLTSAIHVSVRQYLFISKVMRKKRLEPIVLAHAVIAIIISSAFALGGVVAYSKFHTSAVSIADLPVIWAFTLLFVIASPTMLISQFVYIQTNGVSRTVSLIGKIARVVGFVAASIGSIFIAWLIVILSDPSTE